MYSLDYGSLICDFAETYHVYDLQSLPVRTAAFFACGLRESSRIRMKISGYKVPMDTLIAAKISDVLSLMLWSQSEKGTPKPQGLLEQFLSETTDKAESEEMSFESGSAFEKARKTILEGGG